MNAIRPPSAFPTHVAAAASAPRKARGFTPAPAPMQLDAPVRHVHRAREFGVGYGSSSGYGSVLHFTDGHVDAPFRFR